MGIKHLNRPPVEDEPMSVKWGGGAKGFDEEPPLGI